MTRLVDVAHSRDNNFHLLRVIAASAVLYSHSFPLATGKSASEPLRGSIGCTFGSIAVDLFFVISGMLVTMSLLRRSSALDFIRARFFRIWPGLTAAVLLSIFVLGPAFTTLPVQEYFSSKTTLKYLVFNLTLFKGVFYALPGVFSSNPWPEAVNGSLWTLPMEVACYVALLASWLLMRGFKAEGRIGWLATVIWLALLAWFGWDLRSANIEDSQARLWLMFTSGVMLYLSRTCVSLSWWWLALMICAACLSTGHPIVFGIVYAFALPYTMLCLTYLPRGTILQYNRLGDYSYGIYIYAFPVQQSLMHAWPRSTPIDMFWEAMAVTVILAVLSWHFVEKPALALARPGRKSLAPVAPAATET
jgi:peptidoglycan/LPS O-acetylase OafA/YrhL